MWSRLGRDGNSYWGKSGAGIFFTDGSKVLLLKRSEKGDGYGTWGLPGGKAEQGESAIDTARRESKEECGKVKGRRFDELEERDGLHKWTTFFFKIEKPFKCRLSDEHTEYKWFKLDELDEIKLHPKLKSNIDRHVKVVRKHLGRRSFSEWLSRREAF